MGDHFHIEGIPGLDGDYPFPETDFTGRELHLIKKHSGVRAGEIEEALNAGDYDVILCVAVIAMERQGKTVNMDMLLDAPVGRIQAVVGEGDAGPPDLTPTGPDGSERTSGPGSSGPSVPPATSPSRTGSLPSGNSHSDPVTSTT